MTTENQEQLTPALTAEQRLIVDTVREETKAYLDNLFRNPVMLDSLASALMSRAVAAFHFRAEHSTQRVPTLVVSDSYIPGAVRITVNEDGSLYAEEQKVGAEGPQAEWDPSPSVNDDETVNKAVRELALSYGAVPGKHYYVLDDISLDTYRKELSEKVRRKVESEQFAQQLADQDVVKEAAAAQTEPAVKASSEAF